MQLQRLFEDREAVSPVIGVILMVAITVILAAVIGTFVLGLGDQVGDSAPNANWNAENGTDNVTFTHEGGDAVDAATLSITADDGSVFDDDPANQTYSSVDRLTAGDNVTRERAAEADATVRLIWESGDRSTTLESIEIEG